MASDHQMGQPPSAPTDLGAILSEGITIAKILGFWIGVAAPAFALEELFAAGGTLGGVLELVQLFFVVVGVANVVLFVLLRARELA